MDFNLTEEQKMLIETLRTMGARENFKDLAKRVDATGEYPAHLLGTFAEMGLLGMVLSPEYGGGGQPAIHAILAIEELAKFSPMIASSVFESNVGPVRAIDLFGTDEQKKAILPGVCKGEKSVSVCMTEPEAGSDLTALTTRLVEDGDDYILNGRKIFISGAGHASHYFVYARFGDTKGYKGIGGVIAEKGMPGFSFGRQEEYLGLRGMPSQAECRDPGRGVSEHDAHLRHRAVRERGHVSGRRRRRPRGGQDLCAGASRVRKAHLRISGCSVPHRRHGHEARGRAPSGLPGGHGRRPRLSVDL
jgi:hypothetical protein